MGSSSAAVQPLIELALHPGTMKRRAVDELLSDLMAAAGASSLDEVGAKEVHIDLRKVSWMDLSALLLLLLLLEKLAANGAAIHLALPERDGEGARQAEDYKPSTGERLWSFLHFWGVFAALEQYVDNPANLLGPAQAPLLEYESLYKRATGVEDRKVVELHGLGALVLTALPHVEASIDEYFARLDSKVLLNTLCLYLRWDRRVAKQFLWSQVGEGVSNSIAHSRGTHTYVIMRKDPKRLHLAIGDDGVGIPNSVRRLLSQNDLPSDDAEVIDLYTTELMLQRSVSQSSVLSSLSPLLLSPTGSDADDIDRATHRGTTSNPLRRGYGLYFLKRFVLEREGELQIRSGRGCVTYSGGLEPADSLTDLPPAPGTVMRVILPLDSTR